VSCSSSGWRLTRAARVRAVARAKIADVDAKLTELARIKGALERLARACRGSGPTSDCPILDAMEKGKEKENDDADR
jgi:MerR family copper efflux transcriptional regulator